LPSTTIVPRLVLAVATSLPDVMGALFEDEPPEFEEPDAAGAAEDEHPARATTARADPARRRVSLVFIVRLLSFIGDAGLT
jgi:hypothetical protein